MPWYAIHARSCSEQLVESRLAQMGVEAYLPSYTVTRYVQRARGNVKFRRPLFPGYLFARVEADNGAQVDVLRIPQVIRFLGGAMPVELADAEVEAVRRITFDSAAKAERVERRQSQPGETVRICCGALKDTCGTVMFQKNKTRVLVWVESLGQGVSVEVDASWLKPAKAA